MLDAATGSAIFAGTAGVALKACCRLAAATVGIPAKKSALDAAWAVGAESVAVPCAPDGSTCAASSADGSVAAGAAGKEATGKEKEAPVAGDDFSLVRDCSDVSSVGAASFASSDAEKNFESAGPVPAIVSAADGVA